MTRAHLFLLAISVAGVLAIPACSDSDTSGSSSSGTQVDTCNDDPFACPAGQTCWVSGTQSAPVFECLNSGQGQVGEDCKNYIGQPTCADGLTCFSVVGYPNVCTPFCDSSDPAHACPNSAQCVQIVLPGTAATYFACEPDAGGEGGGGAGSGGGGGAGGSGGS